MKKILVLLFSLLIMTGCNKNYVRLEKDDPELHQSLKNYFSEDLGNETVGQHFRGSIASVVRINWEDRATYRYQILLAPVNDENIKYRSITVSCNSELDKYYDKQPDLNGSMTPWLGKDFDFFDISSHEMIEEKSKLPAWIIDASALDYYEQQAEFGYSDDEFSELMKTVQVKIKWNLFDSETLTLTYDGQVETANDNWELLEKREDIEAIIYYEGPSPFCGYYQNDIYPVSDVKYDCTGIKVRKGLAKLFNDSADKNDLYFGKQKTFYPQSQKDEYNQMVIVSTEFGYPVYDGEKCIGMMIAHENGSFEFVDNSEFNAEIDEANRTQKPYVLFFNDGSYYGYFSNEKVVRLAGKEADRYKTYLTPTYDSFIDNQRYRIFWD